MLTVEGSWKLEGSTLTLSISSASEQVAKVGVGKVMTLEVSPKVDQLTLASQNSKLVFERTQ